MNNDFDLQRFATISNSNSNKIIIGTSGNDSISNFDFEYGDTISCVTIDS